MDTVAYLLLLTPTATYQFYLVSYIKEYPTSRYSNGMTATKKDMQVTMLQPTASSGQRGVTTGMPVIMYGKIANM